MNKELICFIGVEGSGKDYQSTLSEEQGYKKVTLASKIKKVAYRLLKMPPLSNAEYEAFKSSSIYFVPQQEKLSFLQRLIVKLFRIDNVLQGRIKNIRTNGRNVLEEVGCFLIEMDKDILCKDVLDKILSSHNTKFCLTDLRKLPEIEYLKRESAKNNIEFKTIFCNYKSSRYNNKNPHISAILSNHLSNIYEDQTDLTPILDEILENYIVLNEDSHEPKLIDKRSTL